MKQRERVNIREWLGRKLGGAWRAYLRRETNFLKWMQSRGVSVLIAQAFLLVIKLAVLGVLLCTVFWLALVVVFVQFAFRVAMNRWDEEEEWIIGEQRDLKESVFYDPVAYNDTTDPRYEDD